MLEGDHIEYDDPRKQRHIHWFYGQYQDMFKDMRRSMGKDIYFKQGLLKFELDLSDIDPCELLQQHSSSGQSHGYSRGQPRYF